MGKNYYENELMVRFKITIPEGFCYKEGTIESGLVIENENGDNYVLIPTGNNLDGDTVRAFWLSCFEISKGENEVPRSIAGVEPWVNINYFEALKAAKKVNGTLISRKEYLRVCKWLISTKAVSFENIIDDGKGLGFYETNQKFAKTGSNSKWKFNGISDFLGNVYTWTKEDSELVSGEKVIRGGRNFECSDECYPPINKGSFDPRKGSEHIGFRICIYSDIDDEI